MAYTVEFAPAAARDFRKLSEAVRVRLARYVDTLGHTPRPASAKKLKGTENAWRLRVGDYRIIYEIHERRLLVMVVRVAHRREAYR